MHYFFSNLDKFPKPFSKVISYYLDGEGLKILLVPITEVENTLFFSNLDKISKFFSQMISYHYDNIFQALSTWVIIGTRAQQTKENR